MLLNDLHTLAGRARLIHVVPGVREREVAISAAVCLQHPRRGARSPGAPLLVPTSPDPPASTCGSVVMFPVFFVGAARIGFYPPHLFGFGLSVQHYHDFFLRPVPLVDKVADDFEAWVFFVLRECHTRCDSFILCSSRLARSFRLCSHAALRNGETCAAISLFVIMRRASLSLGCGDLGIYSMNVHAQDQVGDAKNYARGEKRSNCPCDDPGGPVDPVGFHTACFSPS